jgi:hypothetical protein
MPILVILFNKGTIQAHKAKGVSFGEQGENSIIELGGTMNWVAILGFDLAWV